MKVCRSGLDPESILLFYYLWLKDRPRIKSGVTLFFENNLCNLCNLWAVFALALIQFNALNFQVFDEFRF